MGELTISETGAVTATFQGKFVFEAANGDRLATTYGDGFSGRLTGHLSADGTAVLNVKFDAFFRPDAENSTARLRAAVGGGWRMIARSDASLLDGEAGFTAPFDYSWSGTGTLEFQK